MNRYFRDPTSGLLHLFGALLGVGMMAYLLNGSVGILDYRYVISFTVFSLSLICLYAASSAYHLLRVSEQAQKRLRKLDHSMIFVFIAGTYTPFCILSLKAPLGIGLLIAVWTITVLGVAVKVLWMGAPRWLSTALYVAMGWLVLVAIVPLYEAISAGSFAWLLAGGMFYTVGSVVYALKRPDPYPPHFGFHEIWHLFVLAGSTSQFVSVAMLLPG